MLHRLINLNKWGMVVSFTLITVILSWAMRNYLPFDQMLFNSFSEQLSVERIKVYTANQKKWAWLGYITMSLMLVIKWSLTTIPFYIGAIFFDIKLTFKKAFHIVLVSELIFLLLILVKFAWFYYLKDELTLEYLQFFRPLSLINLFEINELDKWFVYPLQTVNLFEITYWFVLASLLAKEIQKPFWKAFEFVLATYGVGLLVWVIFMSFLILNFS